MCEAAFLIFPNRLPPTGGRFAKRVALGLATLCLIQATWVFGATNLVGEALMKSPPRVTLIGPTNPATTLPNGVLLSHTNSVFRYSGARSETWGDTYPKGYFTVAGGMFRTSGQDPTAFPPQVLHLPY